jgi:hypothetical protein
MKVEYKVEISNPNELLVLEINSRAYWALDKINNGNYPSKLEIETLKIDLKTLKSINHTKMVHMAENLTEKIEYILKSGKTD